MQDSKKLPKVSLIVAHSKNFIIGDEGKLPWHISEDLKRFKELTKGHAIVMGRKTYESVGYGLPERTNVVISRSKAPDNMKSNVLWFNSIESVRMLFEYANIDHYFIIGGGEIYRAFMKDVDTMFVTRVDMEVEGDTSFPIYSKRSWNITEQINHCETSGNKQLAYSFLRLDRKPK